MPVCWPAGVPAALCPEVPTAWLHPAPAQGPLCPVTPAAPVTQTVPGHPGMDHPADPVALTVGITPPHTRLLLLPQHPSSCIPTSRGWCWGDPWHGPALRTPSHSCANPWKRPEGWVQPWERRPGWPHCCPPSTASAPLLPPLHQSPPPGSALGLVVPSGARLASECPRPGCIAPTPRGEPGTPVCLEEATLWSRDGAPTPPRGPRPGVPAEL